MKLIKSQFKVGAWYKTGYHTESGKYVAGMDVKCVDISADRKKVTFLIGKKEQEYDLLGEMPHPVLVKDENGAQGFAESETAALIWQNAPVYGPYTSIYSHNFFSRIAEARKKAGLSQSEMSEILEIPKRTIENWEMGANQPPEYVEKLIIEKLKTMKEPE